MTHTPTPWEILSVRDGFGIEARLPCINGLAALFTVACVYQSDESEIGMSDGLKAHAKEDAEFIVRACNAHANLLSALKEITEYSGGANSALEDEYVMERVHEAISKAEGKL